MDNDGYPVGCKVRFTIGEMSERTFLKPISTNLK
jgi:hypothetical protein